MSGRKSRRSPMRGALGQGRVVASQCQARRPAPQLAPTRASATKPRARERSPWQRRPKGWRPGAAPGHQPPHSRSWAHPPWSSERQQAVDAVVLSEGGGSDPESEAVSMATHEWSQSLALGGGGGEDSPRGGATVPLPWGCSAAPTPCSASVGAAGEAVGHGWRVGWGGWGHRWHRCRPGPSSPVGQHGGGSRSEAPMSPAA